MMTENVLVFWLLFQFVLSVVAKAIWDERYVLLSSFRSWLLAGPVVLVFGDWDGLPCWRQASVPRWGRVGRVLVWLLSALA